MRAHTALWSRQLRTLQTRVGWRLFILFIVCALMPVAVLGVASYFTIADSLRDEAFDDARLSAKRTGSTLLERFGNLEASVAALGQDISSAPPAAMPGIAARDSRFTAVAVVTGNANQSLLGVLPAIPALTQRQQRHLQAGETILTVTDSGAAILMARRIRLTGASAGTIWTRVSDSVVDRVLSAESVGGNSGAPCILLADGTVVRCANQRALRSGAFIPALTSVPSGTFVWESNERYVAGFWSLFLGARFASPDWRIIFSERESDVLTPLTRFRQTFALSTLLAILIVAFLSTGQIRRILEPLAALRVGTERIARLEFDKPVQVRSGDEFEDLADTFNAMSDRVGTQFVEATRLNQALETKSEELEEREARLAAILDAASDAIVTVDGDGRLSSFNRTAVQIFGLPEKDALGSPLDALFAGSIGREPKSFAATSGVSSQPLEVPGRRHDGSSFPAEVKFTDARIGDRVLHTVFVSDISERKRAAGERELLEAQLRHAQKMETIGTLAGGIAHDFNNMLSPIIGYVQMALEEPLSDELSDDMEQVLGAARRAKELVRQILLFSRRGETVYSTIEVGPIVKEALNLLRSSLPSTIEMKSSVSADVATVMGDPTQLHQVLMNLCTNAAHAMGQHGGVLEVTLDMIEVEKSLSAAEQRPVRLVVRDTGTGMDAATLDRMFEPFFTTKPEGEGTGLGMAIVHGIIKHHGGTITVQSTPGIGTTFEILLPSAQPVIAVGVAAVGLRSAGEGRVLVVDDDPAIARLLVRALSRAGYHAVQSTVSSEVLGILEDADPSFDLVITDQTMPGVTGLELADRIQAWRSGFPVILLSGLNEFAGRKDLEQHGLREVLMKPVPMDVLVSVVGRVLNETRSTLLAGAARRESGSHV